MKLLMLSLLEVLGYILGYLFVVSVSVMAIMKGFMFLSKLIPIEAIFIIVVSMFYIIPAWILNYKYMKDNK